jgi:hypothetical protein
LISDVSPGLRAGRNFGGNTAELSMSIGERVVAAVEEPSEYIISAVNSVTYSSGSMSQWIVKLSVK